MTTYQSPVDGHPVESERILAVLGMVRDDIKSDIRLLEGSPFTGPAVAVAIGHLAAQVNTCVEVLEMIIRAREQPQFEV